jgi:Helix-turn-helix domain
VAARYGATMKADAGCRYRLYPTPGQAERLAGWGHACRAVWNVALRNATVLRDAFVSTETEPRLMPSTLNGGERRRLIGSGTALAPGRNVRAKAGLNRGILDGAPSASSGRGRQEMGLAGSALSGDSIGVLPPRFRPPGQEDHARR